MSENMESFIKSEYEIQCFGFSCEQMKTELRQFYENQVESLTNELVEAAITVQPNEINENSNESLKNTISKEIIESISRTSDIGFIKLDNFIDNLFSIPDNVLLIDNYLNSTCTEKDEKDLESEFKRLDKLYKQNLQMMNIMEYELNLHKQLEPTISHEIAVANLIEQSQQQKETNTVELKKIMTAIKETFKKD